MIGPGAVITNCHVAEDGACLRVTRAVEALLPAPVREKHARWYADERNVQP
ncbi:MAG TPA: hypothetical protein VGW33_05605 [Terriglobia bacterium]|nr:hypothetical protein [Terriglobia bacterium]